jgi:hypothetical protein
MLYTSDRRKGESVISLLVACILPDISGIVAIGMSGETSSVPENVGSILPSGLPLPGFSFLT